MAGVPLSRECRGIGHRRPAFPVSCCPNASFKSAPISRPCVSSSTSRLPFQPVTQPRQFIDFGDETPFPPSFRPLVVVTPAPRSRHSGPSHSSFRPLTLVIPAFHTRHTGPRTRHTGPPPSSFRRKPESRGHVPERLTIRRTSTRPLPRITSGAGSNPLPHPSTFRSFDKLRTPQAQGTAGSGTRGRKDRKETPFAMIGWNRYVAVAARQSCRSG